MWRSVRTAVLDLSLAEQMPIIAKFFAEMPFGARTLDYYTPAEWPTPWEILYHGSFCKSSISLLIFYTLSLLHTDHVIELHLIDDRSDIYLLPVIDNKFALNYELGTISDYAEIKEEITVKQVFPADRVKKVT